MLLVVDDNPEIRETLTEYLEKNGFVVDQAADAAEAREQLAEKSYELIILDVMMPGEDGLSLCRFIHESIKTPVILLTAMSEETDRIVGLELGADDYLTKPFAPKELSARIRALLRRIKPSAHGHARIVFGDLELIPDEGKVLRDGTEVHLTKTEFRLLCELAESPGKVLSREALLDKVWGYDYFGDGRLVDVHIRRLRTKVESDAANPRHVVTVRGLGYRLQT